MLDASSTVRKQIRHVCDSLSAGVVFALLSLLLVDSFDFVVGVFSEIPPLSRCSAASVWLELGKLGELLVLPVG